MALRGVGKRALAAMKYPATRKSAARYPSGATLCRSSSLTRALPRSGLTVGGVHWPPSQPGYPSSRRRVVYRYRTRSGAQRQTSRWSAVKHVARIVQRLPVVGGYPVRSSLSPIAHRLSMITGICHESDHSCCHCFDHKNLPPRVLITRHTRRSFNSTGVLLSFSPWGRVSSPAWRPPAAARHAPRRRARSARIRSRACARCRSSRQRSQ